MIASDSHRFLFSTFGNDDDISLKRTSSFRILLSRLNYRRLTCLLSFSYFLPVEFI